MLVLSRKAHQRIIITTPGGERITLEVIELRGDKVRLGIVAPPTIAVNRDEVQARIDAKGVADE